MRNSEKSQGQLLEEQLLYSTKNIWAALDELQKNKVFDFCEGYKSFLDKCKTERECVSEIVNIAAQNGFADIQEILSTGKKLFPGDKVFFNNKGKSVVLAVVGNTGFSCGVNIVGAHIDAPRIDLKPNPVYEDSELVMLKTHYYGGIKKYQWVTIPLALHGIVVTSDGKHVDITIGEDESDPVLTITDLLPHLASEQMQKKMSEGITGEGLNVLTGTIPYNDENIKNKVKLNILKLLNDKYGIREEDFLSAELELVPAYKAKDVGIDRSMIGAYGQDDRVCAYPALQALLDLDRVPEKTCICLLTDKEEIGSVGNTGAESTLFEDFIHYMCALSSFKEDLKLPLTVLAKVCLRNARMLSADVNAAYDPNYEGVLDRRNASYIGKGIVLQKYTGVRGKVGGSDANSEFLASVRLLFNQNSIIWQAGELGKVDQGGGGTIAQYVAKLGAEVLDCGVAVLSMHSPFEITSKADIYMTYLAYKVFYNWI